MATATEANQTVTLILTEREAAILHALTGKVNYLGVGRDLASVFKSLDAVVGRDFSSLFTIKGRETMGHEEANLLSLTISEN